MANLIFLTVNFIVKVDILETKERHVTSVWKIPSNIIFKFCNLLKTLQINKLGNQKTSGKILKLISDMGREILAIHFYGQSLRMRTSQFTKWSSRKA